MKIKFNFGAILLLLSLILSNDLNYTGIYILCAAVHELGHLAAAKILKIKIRELSFDIAGAKIVPACQINSYRSEFFLCGAGPIASILLFGISSNLLKIRGAEIDIPYLYTLMNEGIVSINSVLIFSCIFSLLQATVNLIPISSFDGGRMLNAIITYFRGEKTGETVSEIITFVFALILWMASVYLLIKAGQGLSLFSFSLCMFLKIFEKT